MKLYEPLTGIILAVLVLGGFWFGVRGDVRLDELHTRMQIIIDKTEHRRDQIKEDSERRADELSQLREMLGQRVYRLESQWMRHPTDTFMHDAETDLTPSR